MKLILINIVAGWGTNEGLVISILGHRNAAQRKLIRQTYAETYGEDLLKALNKELTNDFEVSFGLHFLFGLLELRIFITHFLGWHEESTKNRHNIGYHICHPQLKLKFYKESEHVILAKVNVGMIYLHFRSLPIREWYFSGHLIPLNVMHFWPMKQQRGGLQAIRFLWK
jgi:hypothetical protein